MKKIITLLLAAVLAVAPLGVAAENTENIFIEKLSSYSPEQRAQYIAMLRPFLTSDAGVEAGIDNVKSGLFEMMLGVTFTSQQEDMIIRTFKSMSCIKEDTGIRLKYADIFQNKIPTEISATTAYGIDRMIQAMGEKSPSTEKIIREDGYTAGVVANMLRIIPEVNKTALLEYKNGEFSVANINSDFARDYDAVWAGYTNEEGKTVTAYGFASDIAALLNKIEENDRMFTAKALQDIGVCKISGDGMAKPNATATETEHYTVITSMSGVANSIFESSVVIRTKANIPQTIQVLVQSGNPMIYKLVGAGVLEPVKYSMPTDNGILAAVEPDTVYVIKTCFYPFTDANGWGRDYIAALNARGIINGKSETEFMPDAPITREEFIKLVVELFGLLDQSAVCEFTDVPQGAWYEKYVASAKEAGITDGIGDGKFGTGQYIKRQDMAKIINTILLSKGIELPTGSVAGFKDDAEIAAYAKIHVYAISGHIISGDDLGNFNPNKNATRQEAAKMVYGMLKLYIS